VSLAQAQLVADAVLYEGYVLYPYRASAAKNQVRWQFGVVAPRAYSERGATEPWVMQTESLIEPGETPVVDVTVRFLQVQARTVEEALAESGGFQRVESIPLEDQTLVPWEEGVERLLEVPGLDLRALLTAERAMPLEVPGGEDVELVDDATGVVRGRVVRERWPISAVLRVSAEALPGSLLRLRVRIENPGPIDAGADRDDALRRSLVGTHTLLAVRDGGFVSLLDPPGWAQAAAAGCENLHTWPVLVGDAGSRDVMLSSPIILYDYPHVAPESPGDLCDATEIDEILTLRIMTLTEEEKREARGTDARARRIIERSEAIPPEIFDRLHGVIRYLAPPKAAPEEGAERAKWAFSLDAQAEASPEEASVGVGRVRVTKGARVRLRPRRRADSMDVFLDGRTARVEGVYRDVDDEAYVAVIPEDDPGADLHSWYGRFLYFYPDEIEPLESGLEKGH
jgi:hypothetical protein